MKKSTIAVFKVLVALIVFQFFLSFLIACSNDSKNSLAAPQNSSGIYKESRITGSIELGNCKKVVVRDKRAFIIDSHYGMHIIDLDDKSLPETENSLRAPWPNDLCIIEDTVYMSDYIKGLIIADISDIANSRVVNEVNSPNQIFSIYCTEDNLFVATQYTYYEKKYSNLIIYGIEKRQEPVEVSELDRLPWINDIYVSEDYAYLAFDDSNNNTTGMLIIDVSNIKKPEVAGKIETNGFATNLIVDKDYVFLADDIAGLKVLDVSSKHKPSLISMVEVQDHATDVVFYENDLYLSDGYNGIKKVNLDDIKVPKIVDSLETLGFAKSLFVNDEYIYIADSRYFTIVKKF